MIGCLVEKQLTTPQQYPLTLNALVLACNQSSNRDPVVSFDEPLVQRTLASLKEENLVRFVYPSSGRSATRYRQVIDQSLALEEPALALLAVLLLRGPQTVGELRTRTERMSGFESLGAVADVLELMAAREEPLVERLSRRPGQKEERWQQLLTDAPSDSSGDGAYRQGADMPGYRPGATPPPYPGPGATTSPVPVSPAQASPTTGPQEMAELVSQVAALRDELAELRAAVAQLQERL